jgi:hypothetical protein
MGTLRIRALQESPIWASFDLDVRVHVRSTPSYVVPDEVLSNNLASISYLCNQGCTPYQTLRSTYTKTVHGTKQLTPTLHLSHARTRRWPAALYQR